MCDPRSVAGGSVGGHACLCQACELEEEELSPCHQEGPSEAQVSSSGSVQEILFIRGGT